MKKLKILVFSGAGIDKESGIQTFRDSKDGLWNNYKIEDVASVEGWKENPQVVLDFYNARRTEILNAQPNQAHYSVADLSKHHDVTIVTQNVSDLHERAGSTNIIHLHGEILKSRCLEEDTIHECRTDITLEDKKRPHIVWFGEGLDHDLLEKAKDIAGDVDVCIVVGTSMKVFPAATLPFLTKHTCLIYYVDPGDIDFYIPMHRKPYFYHIKENASTGIDNVVEDIIETFTV